MRKASVSRAVVEVVVSTVAFLGMLRAKVGLLVLDDLDALRGANEQVARLGLVRVLVSQVGSWSLLARWSVIGIVHL